MKKKYIVFVIIFIITIGIGIYSFSINKQKEYYLNDEIRLYPNQKAKVEDLNIVLKSISVSSCPKGVECIWQGEYTYKLLINDESIELGTISKASYEYKDYRIVLSENTSNKYIQFKIIKVGVVE